MATLDLTLDSFQVPALSEYTPPFGTKKSSGGLSTQEVNDNIMMPFTKERPVAVTEDSSTSDIEADSLLNITATSAVTVTLGDGAYSGVSVKVLNSSSVTHTIAYNSTTITIRAYTNIVFKWVGSAWRIDNAESIGKTIVCEDTIATGSDDDTDTANVIDLGLYLNDKDTIKVLFTSTCKGTRVPEIKVGDTSYPIYVSKHGAISAITYHTLTADSSNWFWQAYTTLEMVFLADSGCFLVQGNPTVLSSSSDTSGYTVKADGFFAQWVKGTPSSASNYFTLQIPIYCSDTDNVECAMSLGLNTDTNGISFHGLAVYLSDNTHACVRFCHVVPYTLYVKGY